MGESADRLTNAFSEEASSKPTIYNWCSEFERYRSLVGDQFCEERLRTDVTDQNITTVQAIFKSVD